MMDKAFVKFPVGFGGALIRGVIYAARSLSLATVASYTVKSGEKDIIIKSDAIQHIRFYF
jgi:hypothetical protein